MAPLVPESEDFLYWAPEYIFTYPVPPGPEDAWFLADGRDQPAAVGVQATEDSNDG
ncbi:MAG: hypothetical protein P8076_13750 [Gammaproteobacteria bacterium]